LGCLKEVIPVSIQVRYFASMRERMGRAGDTFAANGALTVADLWSRLSGAKPLPPNTLVAVNMEYSRLDTPVRDGDEVAFFPPVTGG
jgi:molybdopterin synthase sulfur carrier subunit